MLEARRAARVDRREVNTVTTANLSYSRTGGTTNAGWAVRAVRNGLVAGLAMAMVVMGLGIFDQGFFAAPSSIWAFFAGPASFHPREFDLSFVLGAMGHMMNSAVLGVVFAAIVVPLVRPRSLRASALSGVAFALTVLAVMWYVVLPIGPNGELVKGAAAGWIWLAGHLAFGMVGGALYWSWR
jgi:hypothetical protein